MSDHTHTEPRPARRSADGPPPRPNTPAGEEGFVRYDDDEVNNRYEEIKRAAAPTSPSSSR